MMPPQPQAAATAAMRSVRTASGALALLLGSCAAPVLEVEPGDPVARVLVDGQQRSRGPLSIDQPYYGTAHLAVVPAMRTEPDERPRTIAAQNVTLAEPFTPWIFPFDFFLEALTYPWRESSTSIRLQPRARDPVVGDTPQPEQRALRRRERATRLAR